MERKWIFKFGILPDKKDFGMTYSKYFVWFSEESVSRTITTSYYRVSDVVILVFDTTDENSFKNIRNWLDDVRAYAHENVDIMLVGNKVDLEDKRQVDHNTAKNFANEHLLPYMETSARNGLNVDNVFSTISLTALNHK